MGQRLVSFARENRRTSATPMPHVAIFPTQIGWMGLVGRENHVQRLIFGHSSGNAVRKQLSAAGLDDFTESDWFPELRLRLEAYAAGEFSDFSDVSVELGHLTAFQNRVVTELRQVPFGQTVTYAELAARAGSPKAARAVGSVMAQNRVPLIIPCHRVLGSGGHLGGFSAPRGIAFKKQLLALEARPAESVL